MPMTIALLRRMAGTPVVGTVEQGDPVNGDQLMCGALRVGIPAL